jgi:hypothetical protein
MAAGHAGRVHTEGDGDHLFRLYDLLFQFVAGKVSAHFATQVDAGQWIMVQTNAGRRGGVPYPLRAHQPRIARRP